MAQIVTLQSVNRRGLNSILAFLGQFSLTLADFEPFQQYCSPTYWDAQQLKPTYGGRIKMDKVELKCPPKFGHFFPRCAAAQPAKQKEQHLPSSARSLQSQQTTQREE